jgi:STE24 endopeptidase
LIFARAVLVAFLMSCVAAGVVAIVSRTPESVRAVEPDGGTQGGFTDVQIARHGAYRGPLYLALGLGLITEIALLVLLRGKAIDQFVRWTEPMIGGWPVRAVVVGGAVAACAALVALPLGFVRGYAIQKAWHLATQNASGWALDQVKGIGISVVIAAIAAVAFFAVVRWQPRWWWLWGAGAFTVLTAALVFLYPVAIAPLFNRFVPLDNAVLEQRIGSLADAAGIDVDRVLVADASTRSTTENAYVAGLGATKQIVLYDTLISGGDQDETVFVVAHELGHEVERHVLKGIVISALGLLLGFGALSLLVARGTLFRWTGAGSLPDLRIVPGLVLFAVLASVVLQPIENSISRRFEARADEIAFDLTGDPQSAIRTFRRLAISNIADLRPSPLAVWMLYSHPPVDARIRAATAAAVTKP